ncbi:MAG: cell division protein ZipA C-terminal FtsZ-binding domain-containing protein [Gammaproteobacteria bacterium]|nr:cell division protein ZipA C-terminal FtsZ-binding domain-containing protein [Gammaproteobacteria bacterium]
MQHIQLVLLVAGVVILMGVTFFAVKNRFFNHRSLVSLEPEQDADIEAYENEQEYARVIHQEVSDKREPVPSDFITISVHAKSGRVFTDYDFLQTLGAVGLVYGEHKIFHYEVKTEIGLQRLFSVAQLNNPGTFDLDHIHMLNCKGLLFFIDLRHCHKPVLALDSMLEVAYQLADELDAIMFEGYAAPWQEDTPRALSAKLDSYQKKHSRIVDHDGY